MTAFANVILPRVRYDDRLISHRVRVEILQCMALRL